MEALCRRTLTREVKAMQIQDPGKRVRREGAHDNGPMGQGSGGLGGEEQMGGITLKGGDGDAKSHAAATAAVASAAA